MKVFSSLIAVLLALAFSLPAVAAPLSPVGTWEIEFGDSRYEVTLCGDGTELCGKLIWLGNGGDTPENLPYLNTLLIDHAKRLGPYRWRGDLNLWGQTATGTIDLVSNDLFLTQGCVLFVICRTYKFYRID